MWGCQYVTEARVKFMLREEQKIEYISYIVDLNLRGEIGINRIGQFKEDTMTILNIKHSFEVESFKCA